nr:hypothetical protein OG781_03400 [Streptomyces sp. NBC_00830]
MAKPGCIGIPVGSGSLRSFAHWAGNPLGRTRTSNLERLNYLLTA